jgi:hypothetical protein
MRNLLEGWVAAYGYTDFNTNYIELIDDEVNKHLWKALKKLKWKISQSTLSIEQRDYSGVKSTGFYLNSLRNNMIEKDRELFKKYWNN